MGAGMSASASSGGVALGGLDFGLGMAGVSLPTSSGFGGPPAAPQPFGYPQAAAGGYPQQHMQQGGWPQQQQQQQPPQGFYPGAQGGYGAPQGGFGAPQGGFGAPQGGFAAPQGAYGQPPKPAANSAAAFNPFE
jgi:hypothetical protein